MGDSSIAIEIEADESGITLRKNDILEWSHKLSWDEVGSLAIRVKEGDIGSTGNADSKLPIEAANANVTLNTPDQENAVVSAQSDFWEQVEGETGITYFPEADVVKFPESKSATGAFGEFVEFLFKKGLLTKEDLPIEAPRATKNYILNDEPVNQVGEKMPGAKEAVDGVYFESKTPRDHKQRFVKLLAEEYAGA